jgi:AAA15 family ATPase/GTPase
MEVPVLKQAVIYGANGSGKSNFIKAIMFLREFITQANFLQSVDLDDYIFQLTNEKSQTVSFEIEFFRNSRYYIYSVDIGKEKISEKLFVSGLGRIKDKLLFERNGTDINSPYLQNESSAKQLLLMNPQSSLLPLTLQYPVLQNNNDVKEVYCWVSTLEIITVNSQIPLLISMMSSQPKLLKFANEVFTHIGIGVNSVEIIESDFEKWIAESKHENLLKQIIFDQFGQSGYRKKMNIMSQSDGTVRLLTLIPALFGAMYQNKTVFVDEIDNSIHPNLMFELIRFYANNKSNGQLIFTTHTTKLLNQQELVRPDEVWLTEKSEGNTNMFSLNDFKLHNTLNIENGYLDGRYGAVPVVEELSV